MRYSNYRFTLDLQKHQSQMSIAVFKNDTAVRLRISLTDGGKSYFIEDGCIAKFFATRSDGEELIHNCMIEGNTEIIYDFEGTTSFVEGITTCQIRLYGLDGDLISAPRFIIVVDERVVIDAHVELPEDTLSGIDALISAETVRVANETNRVNAEAIRVANEKNRAESENARITNEAIRVAYEQNRNSRETERIEKEVARQKAETDRQTAESERGKRLTELENKAVLKDKNGNVGVEGDFDIGGNLNVRGKTNTIEHETLLVKDNIVVVNSDGASSFSQSGLVISLGGDAGYGILHQNEELRIGRGKITRSDEEGVEFAFTYDEGAPRRISTLDPDSEFLHGQIPAYDADKSAFVSSGKNIVEVVTKAELSNAVGDIDSSLDAILAIQASLIGGES